MNLSFDVLLDLGVVCYDVVLCCLLLLIVLSYASFFGMCVLLVVSLLFVWMLLRLFL